MQVDAAARAAMKRERGLEPLATEAGLAALDRGWALAGDQVMVLSGQLEQIRAWAAKADRIPVAPPEREAEIASHAAETTSGDGLRVRVQMELTAVVADHLKMSPERIDAEKELSEYGLDSVGLTAFGNALNERYELNLAATVFFEYPTLASLSDYLAREHPARLAQHAPDSQPVGERRTVALPSVSAPTAESAVHGRRGRARSSATRPTASPASAEPIAIIGIAGRYPKARSITEFWHNLTNGVDCITEIPRDRWDWADWYSQEKDEPWRIPSKWGGFLSDLNVSDASILGISPQDAERMNLHERLFLETVRAALEAAACTPQTLRESCDAQVGVYVGAMASAGMAHSIDGVEKIRVPQPLAGIANWISYHLGLEGPSIAVDTMSSSASVALDMACKGLRAGECRAAIVGGMNLVLDPGLHVALDQWQMLASDPNHRSFGSGDGFHPSEGVGAVVLKPLSKAVAAEDPVLAVIRSSVNRSCGRSGGYGAANLRVMENAVSDVLVRADASPQSVSYVESAAIGFNVLDSVEVQVLNRVFRDVPSEDGALRALGSVESNIGHAVGAACMAQLAKVVLQLHHRKWVPSINMASIHPDLDIEKTPYDLQESLSDWPPLEIVRDDRGEQLPRRALVNSFGAGGTYVSLLVEEHEDLRSNERSPASDDGSPQVVVLSARSRAGLGARVEQVIEYLEYNVEVPLADIAYTLQVGRETMEWRLAVVVQSRPDLLDALRSYPESATKDRSEGGWIVFSGCPEEEGDSSLQAFCTGKSGAALVQSLIEDRDMEGIARLWVMGAEVPWKELHHGSVRRVMIPTWENGEVRHDA